MFTISNVFHYRFVTEGYICLLAMTLLGISNLDDTPSSDYSLSDLASKIVDECWPIMLRGTNEVLQADEKPEEECICICDNGNSLVVVCKDCSKSISDREDITFL